MSFSRLERHVQPATSSSAELAICYQSPWTLSRSGARVLPLKVSSHCSVGLVPPSLVWVFLNSKAMPTGCNFSEDDVIAAVYSFHLFVLLVPVHIKTAHNTISSVASGETGHLLCKHNASDTYLCVAS